MRMKARVLIGWIASALLLASPAGATGLAGWDFSQYIDTGVLSIDGATFTNTLGANYSELSGVPQNAGPQAGAFGTMYMDGTNGSSTVDAGGGSEQFVPTTGSLTSNIAFSPTAANPFNSFSILTTNGQQSANNLSMLAISAVSIVFKVDLSSL